MKGEKQIYIMTLPILGYNLGWIIPLLAPCSGTPVRMSGLQLEE